MINTFMIIYFLLYYGVLFVLNSFLVYKRTGKNPYVLGKNKGVNGYVEKSIKIVGMVIPAILLVNLFSPKLYQYLIPIHYLEEIIFDYLGISTMILGFIICLSAQFTMQSSWKIGIEINSEVKLITEGIFRYSRNPFFFGTLLSYLGFFFVLPNILSFTVGIVYFILIQIQVRLEEENLSKSLGKYYQNYYLTVRRWI